MKVNFFNPDCQESTSANLFGLLDDSNAQPAYIDFADQDKWIAKVENDANLNVVFTAIDNCILILRSNGEMESRCDCMLSYSDNIVFLELKEIGKGGWINSGIKQLQTTIQLFSENHDLVAIRKRRAFLANRKSPTFQYGHAEAMERFRQETKVRLVIHNTIKI